ncbi:MAG TPA: ATP-binding protein [Steroidobacteraceae bacterium]|nr:ATP-binding protein [Steroidobacteraceae bacterium]
MSARFDPSVLARLDAALAGEVLRLRARYQLSLDEFRGLYVSDEQVDALLARSSALPPEREAWPSLQPGPALRALIDRFGLDGLAADLLILALAPDIDPKYATLIAYLNDDVRRRWPSVDLAGRLFGATEELIARLAPAGPLFGPGLLVGLAIAEPRTLLPQLQFAANPILVAHLLGRMIVAPAGLVVEEPSETMRATPLDALEEHIALGRSLLAVLTGTGGDRAAAVRDLAGRLGRPVVRVALVGDGSPHTLLRDGILAARVVHGLLLIEPDTAHWDVLPAALAAAPVPAFVIVPQGAEWRPMLATCAAVQVEFTPPDYQARRRLWTDALQRAGVMSDADAIAEVADRFRLSAQQIDVAAASLRIGTPSSRASGSGGSLIAAARARATGKLASRAQSFVSRQVWSDLVLPDSCLRQLRQFAASIRHRERVFGEWGLSGGPGLSALFAGAPGTGKTMSAGILAHEAGLDLWRIDLSAVVSKYIGETEKHLDLLFAEARDGNAILFFDEADALFGKRSEVRDAHDRYANIEVAFLLQRMETHDGVVILATNLARNLDTAFSRRLHYVVDFPQPDVALRERLWHAAFRPAAPLARDVDFGLLARQFTFTGGDIHVTALDAAFAAAADGVPIDMTRLMQAVGRQLLKQGKVPQRSAFGEHAHT